MGKGRGPTEAEFLRQVLQLARVCGWRVLHLRPARTRAGWRTAVQGDGVGFPDILAVHPSRGLFVAELKSARGRLTPEQALWLQAFHRAGVLCYIFRPDDWPAIEAVLKGEVADG